jgi:hypothetical protein
MTTKVENSPVEISPKKNHPYGNQVVCGRLHQRQRLFLGFTSVEPCHEMLIIDLFGCRFDM